ncbi:MAG: nucleotidyltransferase domain-containing protein [Phycisphaerae bacterium]|nr:nucleotidyltransferase domain-containing protein [Phycisphaerae bacterium]
MKLDVKEKQIVGELAETLKMRFGAERVVMFGSAVRDELVEGSDIDILVVLDELDWDIEKQIVGLCFDAELECGRVISTVCLSRDEFENSPLRQSPLVLNALAQGRTL